MYPESNISQFFSFHTIQIAGPCPINNEIIIADSQHEGLYFTFQVTGPKGHSLIIGASYSGFALLENAENNGGLEGLDGTVTTSKASRTAIDKSSLKHTLVALLRQKLPGFKEVKAVCLKEEN